MDKKLNIKLLGERVLIKTNNTEKKTDSGLIISKANEPNDIQTGEVVAIGQGKWNDKYGWVNGTHVGDKVMFQYGTKIDVEGVQYILVNESDIIMILGHKDAHEK